jgi:hypothetical protein
MRKFWLFGARPVQATALLDVVEHPALTSSCLTIDRRVAVGTVAASAADWTVNPTIGLLGQRHESQLV